MVSGFIHSVRSDISRCSFWFRRPRARNTQILFGVNEKKLREIDAIKIMMRVFRAKRERALILHKRYD